MSGPGSSLRARRSLSWAAGAGVVGLGAASFVLSFSSLRDLAVASGIDGQLAFLWPLVVDGFIVVATAAAFALKRTRRTLAWYPWTALILFSAISVAGNSIHATEAGRVSVPLLVAGAVSAVPAIALLVATHLLVVIVEGRAQQNAPAEEPSAAPVALRTNVSGATAQAAAKPELIGELRRRRAEGVPITAALIAELEGVSERTGRRRLESLRADDPGLFQRGKSTEGV